MAFYPHAMPDGRPAPAVLTAKEAIAFLRLDTGSRKKPEYSLKFYRDNGQLEFVRLGHDVVYPLESLVKFLKNRTRTAP